jgi:hypothetical protein
VEGTNKSALARELGVSRSSLYYRTTKGVKRSGEISGRLSSRLPENAKVGFHALVDGGFGAGARITLYPHTHFPLQTRCALATNDLKQAPVGYLGQLLYGAQVLAALKQRS